MKACKAASLRKWDDRGPCCRTKATVKERKFAGKNDCYLQLSHFIGRDISSRHSVIPYLYRS
jgi:hypothetical protein